MRRLIIEAPVTELGRFVWDWLAQEVESFEILHLFKKDIDEFAAICKVNFKNPKAKLRDVFEGSGSKAQILYKEKNGALILFIKGKPKVSSEEAVFWSIGGYVSNLSLREGILKLNYLGSAREVKALLRYLSALKINYKVDSVADAKFPPDSPLNCLTDKQRKVLFTAFKLGYYNIPRKIRSNELAKKLNIGNPTMVMHRRKAELRLFRKLLSEYFPTNA